MEQCNICGKDFELIDLTCICDKCLGEHSTDIIANSKRSAMCEANSNAVLGEGWRDAEKYKPEYYKKLLLLIEERFISFPDQNIRYIVSGYYHADNVYCDYTGQTINGEERVLKWEEEPAFA